jgi:hypothetical protein
MRLRQGSCLSMLRFVSSRPGFRNSPCQLIGLFSGQRDRDTRGYVHVALGGDRNTRWITLDQRWLGHDHRIDEYSHVLANMPRHQLVLPALTFGRQPYGDYKPLRLLQRLRASDMRICKYHSRLEIDGIAATVHGRRDKIRSRRSVRQAKLDRDRNTPPVGMGSRVRSRSTTSRENHRTGDEN